MRLHTMAAALAAATLPFAMGLGGAGAQSIRHEVNGQAYTYDFKQQRSAAGPDAVVAQAPRKPRSRAAEPSRGQGIPWDEPGKISGVPGVLENTATSLPVQRAGRASSDARRTRAARVAPDAQNPADAKEKEGQTPDAPSPHRAEPGADAHVRPSQTAEPVRPAPAQAPRQGPLQDAAAAADVAKARSDEAEARARIIAEAKARALAEEQRRIEIERSKDRHVRRAEPPAPAAASAGPESPADPASTGAITASRKPAPDAAGAKASDAPVSRTADLSQSAETTPEQPSSWKSSVCRTLFFGMLGC
jgi:hypothetical protein